jgi:hypothetical protein
MGRIYYNSNGVILENSKILFEPVYIPQVGDEYGGGIVISGRTNGGLIAMKENIGGAVAAGWGCFGQVINTPGADGYTDTESIVNQCSTANIAAKKAWNSTYLYSDWFLPSKYELSLVMLQWDKLNMIDGFYWSSTAWEGDMPDEAWGAILNGGSISPTHALKSTTTGLVRAVRKYTL